MDHGLGWFRLGKKFEDYAGIAGSRGDIQDSEPDILCGACQRITQLWTSKVG